MVKNDIINQFISQYFLMVGLNEVCNNMFLDMGIIF